MSSAALACAEAGLGLLRGGEAGAAGMLRRAVALGDTRLGTRLNLAIAEGIDALSAFAAAHPGWDEPLVQLGQALRAAGRCEEASAAYRRALALRPDRVEPLVALGAHLAITSPREARVLLTHACSDPAAGWEAWHALGVTLHADGSPEMAMAALDRAHALAPNRLDIVLLRGEAALAAQVAEAELARLEGEDSDPNALVARAALLERTGRRSAAIDELEAAVELAPDHAAAFAALGALLGRADRPGPAATALRRAMSLDPTAQVRLDLSTVLMRQQRHADARSLLESLIEELGSDLTLSCNLAVATCSLGLQDKAVAIARAACRAHPDSFLAWRALANTFPYGAACTGAGLKQVMQDAAARLPRSPALPRRATRRLRVGLLSGSLKTHPVGWLTVAGFEQLDRTRFDIVCLGGSTEDAFSRRFAAVASSWIDTAALDDAALAATARDAGIDILIDLGGYGDSGRMSACAHRLAPVQVKWVGMQNGTTGLPEMDWIITDRWETPPDLADLYTERLLRLPDGYVCYSPPGYAPDVAPPPALARGHVTFGCFNNLAKITPAVVACWSELLRGAPEARLILKNHQVSEAPTARRLLAAFEAHGVQPTRLELRGASPHADLLAQFADVDIVLDPFPYGGGLTTCEALWMGVPTVTLPGETFASRHTLSHLSNAGLTGWDAASPTAYVALALQRAADLPALAELRDGLRARVKASPLCDAPRFGRSLGAALIHAWTAS